MPASTMPPPEEQRAAVQDLVTAKLEAGAVWCVVSFTWWDSFRGFVGLKEDMNDVPGAIDNSDLLEDDGEENPKLKKGLFEHRDFALVPEEVWRLISEWYTGGPKIARTVVTIGKSETKLELYPIDVTVSKADNKFNPDLDTVKTLSFPRSTTLAGAKAEACKALGVADAGKARLWLHASVEDDAAGDFTLVDEEANSDLSLEDLGLEDGQCVLVEEARADGSFGKKKALEKNRIATCIYDSHDRVISLTLTGGRHYRVAVYCVDYNTTLREQGMYCVLGDGTTCEDFKGKLGQPVVLGGADAKKKDQFHNGQWVLWNVHDVEGDDNSQLNILVEKVDGPNWTVSAVLLDKIPENGEAGVTFVAIDSDTQGSWKGVYGSCGGIIFSPGFRDNGLEVSALDENDGGPRYFDSNHCAQGYKWEYAAVSDIRAMEIPEEKMLEDFKPRYTTPTYSTYSYTRAYASREGPPAVSGVVGLNNLGNTCFMNSALQCLSNAKELREFFLSDAYKQDINPTNPLGNGGKLAEEYASLVKDMWSDKYSVVAPSHFKASISKFAPQFSGYNQHDAQELVAYLLDGLHEDLNRVINKPLTDNIEGDGRDDAEVAPLVWEQHLRRNQSVIVDHFQAQFKSRVDCPAEGCQRVSITFDPYLYLPLPVPVDQDAVYDVVLVRLDPSIPNTKYRMKLEKQGGIDTLKRALAKECEGLDANKLAVCDIMNQRVFAVHPDYKPMSTILEDDTTYVYELAHVVDPKKEVARYSLAPKKEDENDARTTLINVTQRKGDRLVGMPFVISLDTRTATNRTFREAIISALENRHCSKPIDRANVDAYLELAMTNQMGIRCNNCSYMSGCRGCPIPDNDELVTLDMTYKDTVAVTWRAEGLEILDDDKTDLVVEHESMKAVAKAGGRKRETVKLTECLDMFTRKETLGENDMWYCNKCGDFRQATKQFTLWSTPNLLVMHIKRFSYSQYSRDKLDTAVEFPLEGLDLAKWVEADARAGKPDDYYLYDLFAVSIHSGNLGFGHYTAYAKNGDKWYDFNDSHVSEVTAEEVASAGSGAYLLFYRRRNPIPPSQ